eukprot:TRINITY_DN3877_c0_g2_i1.p1 TRINITY_DN3877_c0_g2~~TRINITY_DN3877_c0_g2_i1.p1  ORF type:complete len:248 (+),score=32.30 TRINITY_DN3877_c0_g2_i1:159-902(+)
MNPPRIELATQLLLSTGRFLSPGVPEALGLSAPKLTHAQLGEATVALAAQATTHGAGNLAGEPIELGPAAHGVRGPLSLAMVAAHATGDHLRARLDKAWLELEAAGAGLPALAALALQAAHFPFPQLREPTGGIEAALAALAARDLTLVPSVLPVTLLRASRSALSLCPLLVAAKPTELAERRELGDAIEASAREVVQDGDASGGVHLPGLVPRKQWPPAGLERAQRRSNTDRTFELEHESARSKTA